MTLGARVRGSAALAAMLMPSPTHAQEAASLDSLVPPLMRRFEVPGIAIAVVAPHMAATVRGYGVARVSDSAHVDPERTLFRLASVSKVFVAVAVLQEVEAGRADLHADVNRYLTAWKVPAAFDRPVTLHDLLTHTAGLDERFIGYAAPARSAIGPLSNHLAENLPSRGWAPGRQIGCSNYGFALAAHVVERTSGLPFDGYARDRIFRPLGMARTSYLTVPDSLARDLASGHACDAAACSAVPETYSRPFPAGLNYSTAADMARFIRALLGEGVGDGGRVLSAASVTALLGQQFTHDPMIPGISYALVNQRSRGHRVLTHAGSVRA